MVSEIENTNPNKDSDKSFSESKPMYAIVDKFILDKAISNEPFITHMKCPVIHKNIIGTTMNNREDILDYLKQLYKHKAKIASEKQDQSFLTEKYIIKYTEDFTGSTIGNGRIKILEKEYVQNIYTLLI